MDNINDNIMNDDEQDFKLKMAEDKLIANGTLVEEGIKSNFWQEIIGPELHKLINSASAYQKSDGTWVPALSSARHCLPEERTFDAGYQAALMEFSNNILAFVKAKNKAAESRARREKNKNESDLISPMMEDEQ